MKTLGLEYWARAVDLLAAAFTGAESRLCGYDGATGDGDHGTSMRSGFLEAQESLRLAPAADCGEALQAMGKAFLDNVGGVTGVVFGSMFMAAGESAAGEHEMNARELCRAFSVGLAAVKKRGRAAEGDKSMVDALSPAVDALLRAAEGGDSVEAALAQAAQAAEEGMRATIPMEGKVGRARSQPAKGAGHVDAGAASVCLIFQTLAEAAAPHATA
jgi:dihydroxyacetone kinase-like protein